MQCWSMSFALCLQASSLKAAEDAAKEAAAGPGSSHNDHEPPSSSPVASATEGRRRDEKPFAAATFRQKLRGLRAARRPRPKCRHLCFEAGSQHDLHAPADACQYLCTKDWHGASSAFQGPSCMSLVPWHVLSVS